MQIASKNVKCRIGIAELDAGGSIPIHAQLRLGIIMSTDQVALFESIMGREELENLAALFVESVIAKMQTKQTVS